MKKAFSLLLVLALLAALTAVSAEGMMTIILSDGDIRTEAEGVTKTGSTVKITKPGDYLVSGTLSDGCIEVDCAAAGRVTLYLNGVTIHNSTGPAILIGECSPRAVISLVDQTENALSNGANLVFTDGDEPDGVVFSRSDLTIEGSGELTVTAGAMNGIVSKDDLKIEGGDITVKAPNHGIKGKDFVEITGGTLDINAGRDGIKSTNKVDGARGYIEITGGEITILCGDEAISYETYCTINGGSISLKVLK